MKKLVFIFLFALTVLNVHAQTKVGIIDADYILAQMPEIKTVDDGLKTYNTELQEELQNTVKKYEELIKDYQATNSTLPEDQKIAKENEIITMENDIQNYRQKASVLMQLRRNELTKPLYEKIDVAMRQVITEQNYTQIINANANSLAYSDPKFDITDAVLAKMGITVQ
ncbi:MAG TPA: OmpH family outer membrane protein [Gillisia sp.]|nr:OmpH family outer membrane protein [Gillisia sp.]